MIAKQFATQTAALLTVAWLPIIAQVVRHWIGILLITASLPTTLAADIDEAFSAAVEAVENRDYERLIQILEENPGAVEYSERENCTLFCEFAAVVRVSSDGGGWPEPDIVALNLLLHFGGDPSLSPELLQILLASANEFDGKEEKFPINSGQCTRNRDRFFPLINRMVEYGANLRETDPNMKSIGLYYGFQLCLRPFVCGARYEQPSTKVVQAISESLTPDERSVLENALQVGTLERACIQSFLIEK